MSLIKYTKRPTHGYDVQYVNGAWLGTFEVLDDGYYHFYPASMGSGAWSAQALIDLGNALNELNAPWDAQVNADLGKEKQ